MPTSSPSVKGRSKDLDKPPLGGRGVRRSNSGASQYPTRPVIAKKSKPSVLSGSRSSLSKSSARLSAELGEKSQQQPQPPLDLTEPYSTKEENLAWEYCEPADCYLGATELPDLVPRKSGGGRFKQAAGESVRLGGRMGGRRQQRPTSIGESFVLQLNNLRNRIKVKSSPYSPDGDSIPVITEETLTPGLQVVMQFVFSWM